MTTVSMSTAIREEGYLRQTGAKDLTPTQRRRVRHKERHDATRGQTALIRRSRRTKARSMPAHVLRVGDVVRNLLGDVLTVKDVDRGYSPGAVELRLDGDRVIRPPRNALFEIVERGDLVGGLDPTRAGGAR